MMHSRNLSPRQLSVELGIDYKRLCRWMSRGICRPTNRTAGDLEKLRRYLGLKSAGQLWTGSTQLPDYPEKVRILLSRPFPVEKRDQLCSLIDLLWSAQEVVRRLHEEHGDIWSLVVNESPDEDSRAQAEELLGKGMTIEKVVAEAVDWAKEYLATKDTN
jgi:hypothetical protein